MTRNPQDYVTCAFCKGRGVQSGKRLTCTGCAGTGMHTVNEPHKVCPLCSGVGRPAGSLDLPCVTCKGAGVRQAVEHRESDHRQSA